MDIMRSSRGALCALVVVGSLLVVANAFGPFDSRNAQAFLGPEPEVLAQEPVRPAGCIASTSLSVPGCDPPRALLVAHTLVVLLLAASAAWSGSGRLGGSCWMVAVLHCCSTAAGRMVALGLQPLDSSDPGVLKSFHQHHQGH